MRLLPPSVMGFVPADHVAYFVRDTVRKQLDLSALLAPYEQEGRGCRTANWRGARGVEPELYRAQPAEAGAGDPFDMKLDAGYEPIRFELHRDAQSGCRH